MARENNEGGVAWLSFPYAGVKMEAVVSLKMSDCSMSEKTPQKMNETVKNNSKSTKMPLVMFYYLFRLSRLKLKRLNIKIIVLSGLNLYFQATLRRNQPDWWHVCFASHPQLSPLYCVDCETAGWVGQTGCVCVQEAGVEVSSWTGWSCLLV